MGAMLDDGRQPNHTPSRPLRTFFELELELELETETRAHAHTITLHVQRAPLLHGGYSSKACSFVARCRRQAGSSTRREQA